MRRPVCKFCNNKMKSNKYTWVYTEEALVHEACLKIKDVVVNVEPNRLGAKLK